MLTETFDNELQYKDKLEEYMNDETKQICFCNNEKMIIQWVPLSVEEQLIRDGLDPKNFLPGTFGCHEALDRTSLIMEMVGQLADHPAIKLNEEWQNLATDAHNKLFQLWQKIGEKHV
jgi:hypothetical protein